VTDQVEEQLRRIHTSPLATAGTNYVPSRLTRRIHEAALDVESVEKRGQNQAQGYQYAMAEDIAAAATKALLKQGVVADFEVVHCRQEPITTAKGTAGMMATVTANLHVTDTESGEAIVRQAMGSGSDYPGDKAIYKAMTGARKYAFIHLLGIPIGDDPDAGRVHEPRTRRRDLDPTPRISPERVTALHAKLAERKLNFGQLDTLLGAAGIDALRARSKKAVGEKLASLSPEQADALERELAD
jgi:hypothetical protein